MATDFPFGHNFSPETQSLLAMAGKITGLTPAELIDKAAETVYNRPTKTTYKTYGEVKVVDTDGSLSQIQTSNDQLFWVKTADLKVTRVRQPKETAPVPTVFVHKDPFVIWLHESGCTIVGKTPKQWLEKMQLAYNKATGGELPESEISITEHGKSWSYSLSVQFSGCPANLLPASAKPRRGGLVVCGNAFVLDLLANGFKIGRNEPHAAK